MAVSDAATIWICRSAIAVTALLAAACDSQSSPALTGSGNVEQGKRLLAQYQCGACHAIPGIPIARGVAGPPLSDYGRRSYIAGHIPNQPELLAQWIVNPRALIPTTSMPAMGVSDDDARDMAAYLHSLR
jgi:cytochrome c